MTEGQRSQSSVKAEQEFPGAALIPLDVLSSWEQTLSLSQGMGEEESRDLNAKTHQDVPFLNVGSREIHPVPVVYL